MGISFNKSVLFTPSFLLITFATRTISFFSGGVMDDDPLFKMYEAQAIAVEKQAEIDKLEREKDELQKRMRRLELDK